MSKRINNILLGALVVLGALALAPQAAAQGSFGFSFERHRHGRHVSFGFNIPFNVGTTYAPVPARAWVPGHYEIRTQRVWSPGLRTRTWVPPVWRRICTPRGYRRVIVRPGYWRWVRGPGCWRLVERRVWVPGHWI